LFAAAPQTLIRFLCSLAGALGVNSEFMHATIVVGETLAKFNPGADLYIAQWLTSYGQALLRELGITELLDDPTDDELYARLDSVRASHVRILTTLQGRFSLTILSKIANRLRDRGVHVVICVQPLPERIRARTGAPIIEYQPLMSTSPQSYSPLRVFLCHAHNDKPRARDIYESLMNLGADVWFDEVSLIPGQDWATEIRGAVPKSDLVVVCLSQQSIDRTGFVQREIRLALEAADDRPEGSIFVVPVKLEECDVPSRLARWHWLAYGDPLWKEQLARVLSTRAADLRKRAPSPDA
jgi:hypothetical protein